MIYITNLKPNNPMLTCMIIQYFIKSRDDELKIFKVRYPQDFKYEVYTNEGKVFERKLCKEDFYMLLEDNTVGDPIVKNCGTAVFEGSLCNYYEYKNKADGLLLVKPIALEKNNSNFKKYNAINDDELHKFEMKISKDKNFDLSKYLNTEKELDK